MKLNWTVQCGLERPSLNRLNLVTSPRCPWARHKMPVWNYNSHIVQCHTASFWLQRKVIKNRKCNSPHIQFLQVVSTRTVILYPCTKKKLTSLYVRCTDVDTFFKNMCKHIMNVRMNTSHRSKMFSSWSGQRWQKKWGRHVNTWVSHPCRRSSFHPHHPAASGTAHALWRSSKTSRERNAHGLLSND